MLEFFKKLKKDKTPQEENYVCINCGARVPELYRKYSEAVLKLVECVSFIEFSELRVNHLQFFLYSFI